MSRTHAGHLRHSRTHLARARRRLTSGTRPDEFIVIEPRYHFLRPPILPGDLGTLKGWKA